MASSIDVITFYGGPSASMAGRIEVNPKLSKKDIKPYHPTSLLNGPPLTWKVFRMQAEALEFVENKGHGLMPFAFQTEFTRLFLVAHPTVFWHYDIQRSREERCTYEIIMQNSVCKLYFDLEFDIALNPESNGELMVSLLILIVIHALKVNFNSHVCAKDILILDSSTPDKFSQHIIFPNIIFLNNRHVGSFVGSLISILNQDTADCHAINKLLNGLDGVSIDDVALLTVNTKNGRKLFIDPCVYSRNRHFRILGSSKKNKNIPLVVSKTCNFPCATDDIDTFLLSLITYVNGNDNTKVIRFLDDVSANVVSRTSLGVRPVAQSQSSSPFPNIDRFILEVVSPGKIFRAVFFSTTSMIVYDIVGNRYCGNINRAHKSNNVKYIVDLNSLTYYQKCHDFECYNYRSKKIPLPNSICFDVADKKQLFDSEENFGNFDLSTCSKMIAFMEDNELGNDQNYQDFPQFGLGDELFQTLDF